MTVTVMEPRLVVCSQCGRRHGSGGRCWKFWTDAEFTREHPPGTVCLAWAPGAEEPSLIKILTAANGGRVHIEADGERMHVRTGRVISGEMSDEPEESMPVTTKKPTTRKKTAKKKAAKNPATNGKKTRVDDAHASLPIAHLENLAIDKIDVERNDRQDFDDGELKSLAASIKAVGIVSPLSVSEVALRPGRFRLVAGERRLRAAKLAGLKIVPVRVTAADAMNQSFEQLDENLHRSDLNPIEKAQAIKYRMDEFGLKQGEIAKRLGCTQAQVSNQLRLLELPEIWRNWIAAGKIAPTTARTHLLPWTKRPQVLQWIVDQKHETLDEGTCEIGETLIDRAVDACTRSLYCAAFSEYSAPKKTDCHFKVTKEDAKLLDVEEYRLWKDGPVRKRAWNLEAFDERNAEPLKKRLAKYKAAKKKRDEERSSSSASVASKKQEPAIGDVGHFSTLLCRQLLAALADRMPAKDKAAQLQLLLYFASHECGQEIGPALTGQEQYSCSHELLLARVKKIDRKKIASEIDKLLRETLTKLATGNWLTDGVEEPYLVIGLGELFGLDLMQQWRPSVEQLECCNAAFLERACDVHRVPYECGDVTSEAATMTALVASWNPGTVPAEVTELTKATS